MKVSRNRNCKMTTTKSKTNIELWFCRPQLIEVIYIPQLKIVRRYFKKIRRLELFKMEHEFCKLFIFSFIIRIDHYQVCFDLKSFIIFLLNSDWKLTLIVLYLFLIVLIPALTDPFRSSQFHMNIHFLKLNSLNFILILSKQTIGNYLYNCHCFSPISHIFPESDQISFLLYTQTKEKTHSSFFLTKINTFFPLCAIFSFFKALEIGKRADA